MAPESQAGTAPLSPPARPAAGPLDDLNLQVLEDATGGDRDLMRELAALYLSDADLQLRAIDDAIQSKDLERVRRISHNLLIASESIGANAAAEAFRVLEDAARSVQMDAVRDAMGRGQQEFERVKRRVADLR
jgi:HPt (histidine-containing phosphotransfer) domain-containing protein